VLAHASEAPTVGKEVKNCVRTEICLGKDLREFVIEDT